MVLNPYTYSKASWHKFFVIYLFLLRKWIPLTFVIRNIIKDLYYIEFMCYARLVIFHGILLKPQSLSLTYILSFSLYLSLSFSLSFPLYLSLSFSQSLSLSLPLSLSLSFSPSYCISIDVFVLVYLIFGKNLMFNRFKGYKFVFVC